MADVSPQALDRARGGQQAASAFDAHAETIAASTADVPLEHVLVAVVSTEFEFVGSHVVARTELVERVPLLENGGWAMVFSHGATANHVRARAAEMASLARQRAAAIERIVGRQSSGG
jgi:hypothetical protein